MASGTRTIDELARQFVHAHLVLEKMSAELQQAQERLSAQQNWVIEIHQALENAVLTSQRQEQGS